MTCEGCPLFAAVMSDTEREFAGLPWGNGETVSGPGSTLDATATIRRDLPLLLADLQVTSLLDIPCGDCHWMQAIFETAFESIGYIGADVVRELIERNRQQYPGRRFEHLDMTSDTLPDADVVFVRDGLVHLPYSMIIEALRNIVGSAAKWLITTHFPGRTNHDIKLGHWRPLNLTADPFKLPEPYRILNEQCTEGGGAFTDKSLAVWRIDDIRAAVSRLNAAPKLSIGMATFRDWPGLWSTVESVLLHHADCLPDVEFVIIDNDPRGNPDSNDESDHSSKDRRLVDGLNQQGLRAKYLHYVEVQGTAAAKSKIFDVATGNTVLVVDSHVMLPTGAIRRLIEWAEARPDSRDLWQGPCIGLNQIIGTDFAPRWGSLMFGQWNYDARVNQSEAFEVLMQGCGLFACRRDAWPGFHPLLRGFGPEEFHIHQRFRRQGGRCWCLPWLRWCHRFGNPDGTRPPGLHPEERLRGHLITWLDTGNGDSEWFDSCKRHFLESGMTEKLFAQTFIRTRDEFRALQESLDKSARADAYPCSHRLPQTRTDERPPCQGGPQPIYGCDLHGECSIGRYCTQQTVRACTRCSDRAELVHDSAPGSK